MKISKLYTEFFESEKAGGFLLIGCTILSLILANSNFGDHYQHLWHMSLGPRSLEFWINDGLMTVFFLLVGLEIEREIYIGEFAEPRKAILPLMAALGGMLMPALIYSAFNYGTPGQSGFGIPMATDIAFSLGILSLLGSRVPVMLKVFLTALAIVDDLGAIVIIALFYSDDIQWMFLGIASLAFLFLLVLNRLKVHTITIYLLTGVVIWFCLYRAGIHPTITGVLLAFSIPFGDGGTTSPSYKLQHVLHKPVAFIILPLFALANTVIQIQPQAFSSLTEAPGLGIITGLTLGKPLGIILFSLAGLFFGWYTLPPSVKATHILGVGFLAGIGFTMSIFITLLAFPDPQWIVNAKMAILIASLLAGVLGLLWLNLVLPKGIVAEEEASES
jgi:Na+:H+ antiporter, NhaA family